MEELLELRTCLEEHRYADALTILAEMEEMSKDDKIQKIGSFINVLLTHLINRHAEERTTRSWDTSIAFALFQIVRTNKRRKAGGWYLPEAEIIQLIEDMYPYALNYAALEAFGGHYTPHELEGRFVPETVRQEAFQLIRAQEEGEERAG